MIVLDSHIWFWWINLEHSRIPPAVLTEIETASRVGVSPVSCFELALAHRRGRLEFGLPVREWFSQAYSLGVIYDGFVKSRVRVRIGDSDPCKSLSCLAGAATANGSQIICESRGGLSN